MIVKSSRSDFAYAGNYAASSWGRNSNLVRHQPRVSFGPVSFTLMMLGIALVAGLIYITQAPRGTGYDYDLQSLNTEVAKYESMANDLALENARLTSVGASENLEVLASMEDAGAGIRVAE